MTNGQIVLKQIKANFLLIFIFGQLNHFDDRIEIMTSFNWLILVLLFTFCTIISDENEKKKYIIKMKNKIQN